MTMCTTGGQELVDPRLLRQREMADIAILCAGSRGKGYPLAQEASSTEEAIVVRASAPLPQEVGAQGSAVSELTFLP